MDEQGFDERLKMFVVGAALAATGAAGGSTTASAGCGITLELINNTSASVRVDWEDSDVRLADMPWKRIGSGSTSIDAGDTVYWNFTTGSIFGCNWWRQYRVDVNQGGSSWFEYAPPNSYTSSATARVTIE